MTKIKRETGKLGNATADTYASGERAVERGKTSAAACRFRHHYILKRQR